ncbi:TPA: glycosyltransferase family 9 protein [Pasteurella multocida]|nr:glycosyltransferase family 9 protein [Pasteurella multocida]HDR1020455.1 glycosyltransferase family 9 protein [Pasteurella multocida]HDR1032626.1 glycosyltransferase family 9 protein [Pasteurella multocida]HDR1297740.1 glycosyltransferase family 9 protein [Pasteurella multocida]
MKLKNKLQMLRLSLGKYFLDKKNGLNRITNVPRSILFLRQDGKIGDYVVSSFVFREIKKFNPHIKIGVICTKQNAYLFKQNPYIDQLYYVKKKSILDYIKCGLAIQKEQYDLVIDPTIMIRNRDLLLLRLINAKHYIGYQKANYGLFNINLEGQFHFSELYKLALEKVNITVQDISYDIPFDEQSAVEISEFLQKNQLEKYIAINFYGAARIKKVNDDNIKKYLDYLTQVSGGKKLVLLSYPEVTEKLTQLSADYPHIFVHPTTKIFHTIELIRHCDQLISTDTSTVHIASGFNKPIIGIYKEDPIAFTHWQPKSQAETHILFYKENINELSPEQIDPAWLIK